MDAEENIHEEHINLNELKIIYNVLVVVCKEIDDWEFSTRMSVTKDEVFEVISKLKQIIKRAGESID